MEEDWEYYDDNNVLTDFWQAFMTDEQDFAKPLDIWLRHFTKPFDNGYGWNLYREYWRVWVPLLLAPRHSTTSVDQMTEYEENRVQAVLIDTLEQFICGTENVTAVFTSLAANDAPSAVCGHVFKPGETCYNCRDCGQDATCVLCVECFTHSEHKNHRYRMSTSDGGGYCDCGDAEAFTLHPSCSLHMQKEGSSLSSEEVLANFPQDLCDRARDVLYNVCKYCIDIVSDPKGQEDLVSGAKEKELFPDLKFPLQYSNYCTVLLNDENHSYNDVIRILTKVLPKPPPKLATDLTTYVDKHGKAVIRVGNYQECVNVSQKIETLTRISHATVLKSKVVPSYVVAHQMFVSRLLTWIPSLFKVSSGFRALFSQVVFMNRKETNVVLKKNNLSSSEPYPLCEAVLLNDVNSWKQVRSLWLSLIIDGLMKDYESKRELATIFANNYTNIVGDYIIDDQERESSIMSLSVQIFTVPSLAIYLIEKCDALTKLLQGFLNLLNENVNEEEQLVLNSWLVEEKSEFQRGLSSLYDLTYLLNVVPTEDQWTDSLRVNFKNGVAKALQILSMMQGMDSMRRQVGQHVEMEDNVWKLTYELQSYFGDIVRLIVNWAVSDRSVLMHLIHETMNLITEKNDPAFMKEMSKHLAFLGPPRCYEVVDFDVSKQNISLHVPLHRFLTNLLVEVPRFNLVSNLKQRIEGSISLQHLIEPVLHVIVAVAQINVGMWRRNGAMAESQAFLYNSRKYCPGLREADLLLVQLMAALTDDVDSFLVTILARFKLAKWATGDLDSETALRAEDFVDHCNGLAEQWLGLVIALASERFTPGVGQGIDQRIAMRKEIIQLLCIEPLPHSSIVKRLPDRKNEKEMDEVLNEVAVLKASAKTGGKKIYHLRDGLEDEYNMFYHGYTKEGQTAAQEQQVSNRPKKGDLKECCPPPDMPKLTNLFSGLVRMLQSNVVLQACAVTLRRVTEAGSYKSKYVTERQVHKVLFIIALGIKEQATESNSLFQSRATNAGVFDLVQKVATDSQNVNVPEHVRKLAQWVLKNRDSASSSEPMDTEEGCSAESSEAEKQRKRRADAAAARKAKIMAQMNAAQKNFAAQNTSMLAGIKDDKIADPAEACCSSASETVCLGPSMTSRTDSAKHYTCILCQEEGVIGNGPVMVMASYIQKSTVLSYKPAWDGFDSNSTPVVSPHHLHVSRDCGPHVSTCGHAMHATCYQKFFDSLVIKERDRTINLMTKNMNFDVSNGEFLCPICERLSNTVLPLIPSVTQLKKKQSSAPISEISLNSFVSGLKSSVESWYLKEDAENGPALPRIALKTTLEEQSSLHGSEFSQCFLSTKENDCFPFDESTTSMMNVFSVATFTTSLELNPFEEDYRVPLVSLQAAAFTLSSIERTLWNEDKPLFGSLNPRDEDAIRYIIRFIATFPSSYSKPPGSVNMRDLLKKMKNFYKLKSLQSNAMFILSSMLCKSSPDKVDPLSLDAFGVLVSLTVSLPCLFNSEMPPRLPSGQGTEIYCLKLCLLLHIIQVIYSFEANDYQKLMDIRSKTDQNLTQEIVHSIASRKKIKVEASKVNLTKLYSKLEENVLPFLRCAGLLFQHFTDVLPGKSLVKDGGFSYGPLAKYLGLPPTIQQLMESPASSSIVQSLLGKEMANIEGNLLMPKFPMNFRKVTPPPVISSKTKPFYPVAKLTNNPSWKCGLIPLPRDYTDLMNLAANFVCCNSVTGESKTPALCLVCGLMVCSQSHCCETVMSGFKCGGCTTHARECGADTGIFLRIRECIVVLHSKVTRGTFLPAPYLDEYGEADKGLKRGNPMYLDQEKYEELNRIWLRNEVPEKIARMFDPDILILMDWHSL
eukprot:GFUD01022541.1.p1 GENE.GFUD01022541.1~~GFUD01022541.1.p1  ORF type:complete len:1872 (+),score=427.20 GFUD01022541.1:98-5617(+)